MLSKRYYKLYMITPRRKFSTKIQMEQVPTIELDSKVKSDIVNERFKLRKHPGIMKIGTTSLPESIVKATKIILEDYPAKKLLIDAQSMTNYLFSRHYPLEQEELLERKENFTEHVKSRMPEIPDDDSEKQMHYINIIKGSVTKLMKKYNYNWSALDLNDYNCLVYLLTRAAPNYATILKVLSEIKRSRPDYKPTSLFDFGSGVGSVFWAVNSLWDQSLNEVVNIDSSSSMNELAELILKGGTSNGKTPKGVYFRQFLPAQHRKYSLVVSAHSLMELPSQDSRLEYLLNLWNKTEDFLIIIEQGTKPGFKLVLEARDFVLSLSQKKKSDAYVFAPCPHDVTCPRASQSMFPCHFQLRYIALPLQFKQNMKKELYSYVVIERGRRPEGNNWPRVVRPVLQRHNHVICRLCTSEGALREEIFTKNKHDRVLYKCAKVTNWGDCLPVRLSPVTSKDQPEDTKTDNQLNENLD